MQSARVPWETRLGKASEHEIAARLSRFSMAHRTDVDVGIDFVCELVENDSPTIPFYIQAKGTEHFDAKWGARIKKTTIGYWLSRQSPVYLIVHDENAKECYWTSIEDIRYELLARLSEAQGETIYVKVGLENALREGKDENAELMRKIREDLDSVQQFRGNPPFRGNGYVKKNPQPPRSKLELIRTRETTRATLYSLLLHYFYAEKDLVKAHLIGEFLTKFDTSHYNHFAFFGEINKALGRVPEAKSAFQEALRICRGDKNWPEESMNRIIAYLEKEIESCS